MTKQEIKDLVAAKIAGQGSQVDIGGALADILSGIVDAIPEGGGGNEPLVVEGQFNIEFGFTPKSGQPSFDSAYAAFSAGTPVFMHGENDDMEPLFIQVIGIKESGVYLYGIEPDSGKIAMWVQ